jgi:outer membrane immunogenic protein
MDFAGVEQVSWNFRMKRALAASFMLAALVTAQGAAAADLSLAPLYKAPPTTAALPYDWSGFYLGINGGGGWGRSNWSANNTGFGVNGGQAGGTFGYNRQFGNFVFGVEGDIDWSGLNGTGSSAGCPGGCSTSETWLSTVRGRIGYSFDRVMPYATGGLAVGDIRASMPGFAGGTSTNAGWALGGGVEFALPGNWSAKAEYLRVDLGSFNCTGCTPAPAGNVSLQENVFRAGVNYHFGWGK